MKYEEKVDHLAELNDEAVVFHGIEGALVGYIERFGLDPIAVYDYELVIDELTEDNDVESALEWYGYNTLGTWAGEGTPAFIHYFDQEERCQHCRKGRGWWKRIGTLTTAILIRCGQWFSRVGQFFSRMV